MYKKILLCTAGAQGSIGLTIASGVCMLNHFPEKVKKFLITNKNGSKLKNFFSEVDYAGWDIASNSFRNAYEKNKPIKEKTFNDLEKEINSKIIFKAPDPTLSVAKQVHYIRSTIADLRNKFTDYLFVGINILPASNICYDKCSNLSLQEINNLSGATYQDLPYLLACIEEEIPFINFTPNPIELPSIIEFAENKGGIICGRDGKTGQTYWKVVVASALAARNLMVQGWYSTNILGNQDGLNLNNPENAANKILQKGQVLNKVLNYEVKDHIVHIDYYGPRGDNKEANDIIDFNGFLDEEMSIRMNMLCKDSVLAAPIIMDMAILCAYLKYKEARKGVIAEMAFFFKYPLGGENLNTFQQQFAVLEKLLK